jgi:hypothetical protein
LTGLKGGSSGAFFYTTHDNKFVIKTITTQEKLMFLNRLLPVYLERVMGDSALVRILGVFQVQCAGNYSTNLVLMENICASAQVLLKYDLKGCTYKRNVSGDFLVGKDSNFIQQNQRLELPLEDQDLLLRRLNADTARLTELGVMDYSLLVCLCINDKPESVNPQYVYRSTQPDSYYLIAVIDFFQEFNVSKKAEYLWKTLVKRAPEEQVSCVEASLYCSRFISFVQDSLVTS